MVRIFTLLYRVNKMIGVKQQGGMDLLLNKALRNELSPSEQTLKNIKAFSDAYSCAKSKSMGKFENILN